MSLLCSIIISYLISYLGYIVKDRCDLLIICNREVVFREKCREAGLSCEYTNFAVDWKIHGMSEKELLTKYSDQISSIDSVKTRKRRIKKALNTN